MDIASKQLQPGVAILEMSGAIRMGADCQRIEQKLGELMARNNNCFILDLSGVHFIDSSGVGTIVKCYTSVKKSGGFLCLAGVKGMVEGAFRLTQVNRVIDIYPTAAAAAESFPSAPES